MVTKMRKLSIEATFRSEYLIDSVMAATEHIPTPKLLKESEKIMNIHELNGLFEVSSMAIIKHSNKYTRLKKFAINERSVTWRSLRYLITIRNYSLSMLKFF